MLLRERFVMLPLHVVIKSLLTLCCRLKFPILSVAGRFKISMFYYFD